MYQTEIRELINNLPGLLLAIQKMLNKQEKDFGCFQVKKESDFYSLYIPCFPSFKLYQNPRTYIYRGYWQTSDILPDIKDRTNKPQIYLKKKQISIDKYQQQITDNQNIRLINQQQEPATTNIKTIKLAKKQRIYEVMYKYNPNPEIRLINQVIATCLKEKIEASISSVPENEIMPLVLISEDTND